MADGTHPRRLPWPPYQRGVAHQYKQPVAPAREHSTMSVYVRGMGWVDIKPWRPK